MDFCEASQYEYLTFLALITANRSKLLRMQCPHFITGPFTSHKKFLPDEEYGKHSNRKDFFQRPP